MNRKELTSRIRNITRDLQSTTFRENDIIEFLHEAVDRTKQIIPEFLDMEYLTSDSHVPTHLPQAYHSLLATYASASLYFQDDRLHQATTKMNEFETKMHSLKELFVNGEITCKDKHGEPIYADSHAEYVVNTYFDMRNRQTDHDNGVEGVLF